MLLTLAQACTRSKIKDLRAAIYQLEANTDELRRIKAEMEKHLEAAEEKLVDEFLNMNPMFRRMKKLTTCKKKLDGNQFSFLIILNEIWLDSFWHH